MIEMKQPPLSHKVTAAINVMMTWPELPGVGTVNTLMWPYKRPPLLPTEEEAATLEGRWVKEPDDVRRHAVRLLASVHTALLELLPAERLQRIWTDQDEFLSFALDDDRPCDASPFLAAESPAQAGPAAR